jgi:hypothetical protein
MDLTAHASQDLSPKPGGGLLSHDGPAGLGRCLSVLLACFAAAASILGTASCAPRGALPVRTLAPTPNPAVRAVVAEWRDVERAMEIAVRRAELTILDREIGPDSKRFELQSVSAEPGYLVATRQSPGPEGDGAAITIRLETRIGMFGNPAREQELLRALARRLEQLRGREWAPAD